MKTCWMWTLGKEKRLLHAEAWKLRPEKSGIARRKKPWVSPTAAAYKVCPSNPLVYNLSTCLTQQAALYYKRSLTQPTAKSSRPCLSQNLSLLPYDAGGMKISRHIHTFNTTRTWSNNGILKQNLPVRKACVWDMLLSKCFVCKLCVPAFQLLSLYF